MNLPYAFFGGGQEWLIVLLVILVLFGGSKIPQLMRGVGRGMGELQKGLDEGKKMMADASRMPDDTTPTALPADAEKK